MDNKYTQVMKQCPFVVWIVISVIIISLIGFVGVLAGKFDTKVSFQQPYTAIVLNSSAQKWADPDEYKEGSIAKTTTHHYVEVEDAWFQDALFIGDSSMEELCAYGGLETATYVYTDALNTQNVFSQPLHASDRQEDVMLEQILKETAYSKIYIMIGMNDLNEHGPEIFREAYEQMLAEIKTLQPNTTFFLLSIPAVTAECSQQEGQYQNNMIYAYNYEIKGLTDGEYSLYFNLNQVCCDENGAMKEEYTTDGIHLRAEHYPLWATYIKEHGIE